MSSINVASSPRILIVGGGISGLSAAAFLGNRLPQATIHLLESAATLGGVLTSETIERPNGENLLVERAADNFVTNTPFAARLHECLGLAPDWLSPNASFRFAQVVHEGRPKPIPQGFSLLQPTRLSEIFRSPILGWSGKLRVAAEAWVPRRKSEADESLQDFACRRLGRQAFERLVEPIVCGIFTARPDTLSMKAALPQFVAMEREYGSLLAAAAAQRRKNHKSDAKREDDSVREASGARYGIFAAPRNGMSEWITQIVAALPKNVEIYRNAKVNRLEFVQSKGWLVEHESVGVVRPSQYDACILATNAPISGKLLQTVAPEPASELLSIQYASSVVVAMTIPADQLPEKFRCFGVVVPQAESRNILAISFSSIKYAGRCDNSTLLIRVFMGGAVRPEINDWNEDQIVAAAIRDVQEILQVPKMPTWTQVIRWPNAMPQYELNHMERLERIQRSLQAYSTIALCGNAFHGVGIPQCIHSGELAAAKIAGLF